MLEESVIILRKMLVLENENYNCEISFKGRYYNISNACFLVISFLVMLIDLQNLVTSDSIPLDRLALVFFATSRTILP
jgi:hypothetical protein